MASTSATKCWPELNARVHMAMYRVLGHAESLGLAKEIAYIVGFGTNSDPSVPVERPSSLIEQARILIQEWESGRHTAIAEFLESET